MINLKLVFALGFALCASCLSSTKAEADQGALTNDYPHEAYINNWEGDVEFTVTVGTDGRVQECVVTKSSGHQVLDDATCDLIKRRGRFDTATDKDGKPIVGTWSSKVRWRLPQ